MTFILKASRAGFVGALLLCNFGCVRNKECRNNALDKLENELVVLHTDSKIEDGKLTRGFVPECRALIEAAPTFVAAHKAMLAVPEALRPAKLHVHWGRWSKTAGIEVHGPSGEVLVDTTFIGRRNRTIWLHEIAHVTLHSKTSTKAALHQAIEEGIADYFSAVVSKQKTVGGHGEVRDLVPPRSTTTQQWTSLTRPGAQIHGLGWALASQLYDVAPAPGSALLADIVACGRATGGSTPAEVTERVIDTCPARARPTMTKALQRWLPPELHPR